MLLAIAAILAVAWLLGFAAFHVTAGVIHVLIVAAVIAFIAHFFMHRGGRASRGLV